LSRRGCVLVHRELEFRSLGVSELKGGFLPASHGLWPSRFFALVPISKRKAGGILLKECRSPSILAPGSAIGLLLTLALAEQTFGGLLRASRPMLDVVDDFIARVVGNPTSFQSPPLNFFALTFSSINSAMTSFLVVSFSSSWAILASLAFSFPRRLPNRSNAFSAVLDPDVNRAWLDAKLVGQITGGHLVGQMPSHDLGLLRCCKVSTFLADHGNLLCWTLG